MTDRFAEFAQNDYARQVQRVVEALQAAADAVSREKVAPKPGGSDDKPDHAWHASKVIHELQQTFATLPLGLLVEAASEADFAVREGAE